MIICIFLEKIRLQHELYNAMFWLSQYLYRLTTSAHIIRDNYIYHVDYKFFVIA